MILKSAYNTKQHSALMDYIEHNSHRTFSVRDITDSICDAHNIGKSTVYRLVSRLVDEGILQRMNGDDGKSVVYRYTSDKHKCNSHFHLKCEVCGKFEHLDCDIFSDVRSHIKSHHGFDIDTKKTVIYGLCSQCNSRG